MSAMRHEHWRESLEGFLLERATEPKRWGFNDCAMLCADAIEAMTGKDVAWTLRGEYDSAFTAVKALRRFLQDRGDPMPNWKCQPDGLLGEVAARIGELHGFTAIAPELAGMGDAVLLDVGEEMRAGGESSPVFTRALGVIGVNGLSVTAGENGTVELPRSKILRAWKI